MADTFKTFTFTHPVILFYPKSLFVASAFQDKGDKSFRGTFGIAPTHPDYKNFRDLVIGAARENWPGVDFAAKDPMGRALITWPWRDGTKEADATKAKWEAKGKTGDDADRGKALRGMLILRSKSAEDKQPSFAAVMNGKVVRLEGPMLAAQKDKLFFAGAEVIPAVAIKVYDGNDAIKPSVTCYLNSVLGTGKGTRIGGGRPEPEAIFAGYAGTMKDANPDLDDEIPF